MKYALLDLEKKKEIYSANTLWEIAEYLGIERKEISREWYILIKDRYVVYRRNK